MPNIGPMELIVVLVIALLILGPKRLPAAGRSLGRGIQEFKSGLTSRGESAQVDAPVVAAQTPVVPPEVAEPAQPPAGASA